MATAPVLRNPPTLRRPPREFTDAEMTAIRDAIRDGQPFRQIALEYGCHGEKIRQISIRGGLHGVHKQRLHDTHNKTRIAAEKKANSSSLLVLKIRLPGLRMRRSLDEMAAATSTPVEIYAASLLDASIAEWRLLRIKPSRAALLKEPENVARRSVRDGRRRITPETAQRILFLWSENVNQATIAKSLGIGASSVRRVLDGYKPLHASTSVYAHAPRPGGWGKHRD